MESVVKIKFGALIGTRSKDFTAEFFQEPCAQELLVQLQPGIRLHAKRQQRFANVKARKPLALLSLVLVVRNIFRKLLPLLVNHDVPMEYLITFIAYVLPFSLIFTIPWGLLTAILLVFGRLSADNELIALRSNGVSISRICIPLAAVAIVCTAICGWLNVQAAPAAQEKLRSTIFDLATRNPMALFGSDQLLDQLKSENKRERSASRTEINKRFSFPFACVAFAIIGVPLGVTAHRRETSIGFAMGLIVATSYFLFVIIGDTLRGNPQAHPELLVWFPNVLFIVLGVFLFRRLARQ